MLIELIVVARTFVLMHSNIPVRALAFSRAIERFATYARPKRWIVIAVRTLNQGSALVFSCFGSMISLTSALLQIAIESHSSADPCKKSAWRLKASITACTSSGYFSEGRWASKASSAV